MLMQVDICPACGQSHQTGRNGSGHPRSADCPLVVFGSMPTVTETSGEKETFRPISVEGFGSSDSLMPPLPDPSPSVARKPTGLAVPWPMPSLLEDYL